MTEKLNTHTQPNDTIDRRKLIPGKKRCDWCEREALLVYECACKTSDGTVLWYDLCDDCRCTKAPLLDGGPEYSRSIGEPTRATNVYGPRPIHPGFRCRDCGSEEYPLLGHTLDRPGVDQTRCVPCLLRHFGKTNRTIKPTPEASPHLL